MINNESQTIQSKGWPGQIRSENEIGEDQYVESADGFGENPIREGWISKNNLTGRKFNMLLVIQESSPKINPNGSKTRMWECVCDCGAVKNVRHSELTRGGTKSCGCIKPHATRLANSTHGLTKTPEYKTWVKMKERCNNPRAIRYLRYGGRGIKVCVEWESSFEQFLSDMGKKPTPRHSIERKNNDEGYSKDNCIWATGSQQARNRSSSRFLEIGGISKTLAEWSEISGIGYGTIQLRLKAGRTAKSSVFDPINSFERKPATAASRKRMSDSAQRRVASGNVWQRLHPEKVLRGDKHPAHTNPNYLAEKPSHRITPEIAEVILADCQSGMLHRKDIAEKHGVSVTTVTRIESRVNPNSLFG